MFKKRYILKGKPVDSKEWEVLAEYPAKVNWIDVKEELEDQLGVEYQCFRLDECKPNGATIKPVWTKCKRKSKRKFIITDDDIEKFSKLQELVSKLTPSVDPAQAIVNEMERIASLKAMSEYFSKVFGGNSTSSDDWLMQMLMQMMMNRGMTMPMSMKQPMTTPLPKPQPIPVNQSVPVATNPQPIPEVSNESVVVQNEEVAKMIDEAYREVEKTLQDNAPCKELGGECE